uniref:Uncharacterized protein n=1 Tax=Anguilla anguilla TaxID=7936 RepID=A0A0E9WJP3_ANGAN
MNQCKKTFFLSSQKYQRGRFVFSTLGGSSALYSSLCFSCMRNFSGNVWVRKT